MTQLMPLEPISLLPVAANKDERYRIGKFERWQKELGQPWYAPDLGGYRDHLLEQGYAPATVAAHLATLRSRYVSLVKDNATRDALMSLARRQMPAGGPADWKALVDEVLTRIENAADAQFTQVKTRTRQDQPDADHKRLTAAQAGALMAAPLQANAALDDLAGLRDTAVIALILCTGIREAELVALEVEDLRQRLGGELALHVRKGKGCKERLVPYGELSWVLVIVDRWLAAAGITSGAVFRGFYKGDKKLRPGRLSVRAVQYILASYPLTIEGKLATVQPHDLRRTYARRLYEAGLDLVAIQQNLGHADVKTTLGYIGALDASQRRAPAIYQFDLGMLGDVR